MKFKKKYMDVRVILLQLSGVLKLEQNIEWTSYTASRLQEV